MDLPMRFTGTDLGYLNPDDIIPSNINLSTISYVGECLPVPLTVFVSNPRTTVALGSEVDDPVGLDSSDATRDQGWATLDTVLIRLNTSSTPSGRFPVYSNRTLPDGWAMIGYDAAVCVQRYESWVVETYNASIASPSILRIVGKGNGSTPLFPSGTIRGTPIDNTRYLNTTGKDSMFSLANHGALVRMWHSINLYRYYQSSEAVGPAVPPTYNIFSNLDILRRLFLSPEELERMGTLNSLQTSTPFPARSLARFMLYHSLRGRDTSSHKCTPMRH